MSHPKTRQERLELKRKAYEERQEVSTKIWRYKETLRDEETKDELTTYSRDASGI